MISSWRQKKSANGPDLTYREYWRDERDRITAWKRGTESSQNGMEDGRGDRYHYDEEGQLTSASYRTHDPAGSAGDPMRNDIFSYDALGNRVRSNYLASRGWLDFTRKDNGLNQYSGWWNYSVTNYDDDLGGVWGSPGHANGVLMQEGWITGSYNALNQPVSMWSPAFAGTANWMWFGHDPLGRCVKRWIGPSGTSANNPTYFYYDGWSLIQEGGSASNATRVYVQGGRVDEIVAQITPGNGWQRYFQYDARGHCTLQTDAAGDVVEQYDYDAFGFPYFYDRWGNNMPSSPWGNRFLFTGREWISELRTYDYRNRMYQPELGRFLQPDPKQFEAGDYNLYRYCHNDPVNKSDPMGLYAPEIDDKKTQEQFNQLKEKSQAFRDQFKKWEGDKEKRFVKSANDPGNFKGRNQSPTKNGPGNSTERESLLSRIASWLRGGQGRGGTIYYNPNNRATAQGRDREPIFGFAHELGHLSDIGNGNYPTSLVPSAAEMRAGENTAIGWEREAQSAFGETNLRPYQ